MCLINESDLHILGDAGIGKTHIACNICDDRLKSELPALFVRGSLFTTEQPIETQVRTILDIPPSYSWHNFLQALSAAAEAYHTRIPLIIDGLNESVNNGTFSKIWDIGIKRTCSGNCKNKKPCVNYNMSREVMKRLFGKRSVQGKTSSQVR